MKQDILPYRHPFLNVFLLVVGILPTIMGHLQYVYKVIRGQTSKRVFIK